MMKSVIKDIDGLDVEVDAQYHDPVEALVEFPVRSATWRRIAWFLREDLRWDNRRKFDRE